MNAVSLQNLWNYLQGLSLTESNKRWLSERLVEKPTTSRHDVDSLEKITTKAAPYTLEELNARMNEAEMEIEQNGGKSLNEMIADFKKELTWLK